MYVLNFGWRPEYRLMDISEDIKGVVESDSLMMTDGGLEKSGYIDVKQPPKVKGRKLKSWKKKWVVLQQMSNMTEGTYAAKIDVFPDEVSSYKSPTDKFTLFLENVRTVQPAKSKKHAHAFEIVENEAVLLMAGETELDAQTWIWTIRKIFWPNEYAESDGDKYTVAIVENVHTHRLSLKGVYLMIVTPETIAIHSDKSNSYEWSLNTLKRFNMEKDNTDGTADVLAIECGPKSECGEAIFQFRSDNVLEILASIKKNIYRAMSLKKAEKTPPCLPKKRISQTEYPFRPSVSSSERERTESVTSSEQGFRDLLESPSKHAEKRFRLMSESSEISSKSEENVLDLNEQVVNEQSQGNNAIGTKGPNDPLNDDSNIKNDSNIEAEQKKSPVDILLEPVDILLEPFETRIQSTTTESNYNRIDFKHPADVSHPPATIISTVTVAKPGYQTSLLLDEKGYSHVNLATVKVKSDDDKMGSLCNNSNRSSVSCRTASTGSRDSGILYHIQDNTLDEVNEKPISHPSTNSFDSAVSTSSAIENNESIVIDTKPSLSVEIHEVEVAHPKESIHSETAGESCIYQDVSFGESKSDTGNTERPKLKKSNSTGYFKTDENPYEELDKYRKGKKDLIKHLGMDPRVDPASVPPSLPDRPLSHKMKRKFVGNSDKKIFTLPFARNKSRKNREKAVSSTSSESDSESGGGGKKTEDVSSVKIWPLGDKSITDSNEFYQPIAIERFLNDKDAVSSKITRERSCSLNLNKTPDVKRPSISSANVDLRGGSRAKHGRNASLNVDLLSNDPNTDPFFLPFKSTANADVVKNDQNLPVSPLKSSLSPTNSIDNEMNIEDDLKDINDSHENEPIYAEVLPVDSKTEVEEPFPDMDEWKPQNLSDFQTNELDETNYENKGDSAVDLFNIGFVSKNELNEQAEKENEKTGILIDLFDTEPQNNTAKSRTLSAMDIFNASRSSVVSKNVSHLDLNSKQNSLDMNQAFSDIFNIENTAPLPLSTNEVWNTRNQISIDETTIHTEGNWADFSRFEANQKETTNIISDSIYMDMSTCKNESIYVLPSEAKLD